MSQSNKKKRLGSRRAPAHQTKLFVTDEHSEDQLQVPEVQEAVDQNEAGVSLSRRKLGSSRKRTGRQHGKDTETKDDDEETSSDVTLETHISAAASEIQLNQTSATLDDSFATAASDYTQSGSTPSPEIPCVDNPQDCRNETNLRVTEAFDSLQSEETKANEILAEVTPQNASSCSEGSQDDYPVGEFHVPFSETITIPSSCGETSESRNSIDQVIESSKEELTSNETQCDLLKSSETSGAQFPQVGVNENHEKDESKKALLNDPTFPSYIDETVETSKSLFSVKTADTEDVLSHEDDQNMCFIRGDGFQDERKCYPITGGQESAEEQMHGGSDEHDKQASDEQNVHQQERGVPSEVERSSFSLQSPMSELSTPFKSYLHNSSVSSDGDTNLSGITKHPGSHHKNKAKHVQESAIENTESDNTLEQLLGTEAASQKHDLIPSVSHDSPPSSVSVDGQSEECEVLLPHQEPNLENFSEKIPENPKEKEAENTVDENVQQKEDNSHYCRSDYSESEVPEDEVLYHSSETAANEARLESLIDQNTILPELPGTDTDSTNEDTSSYDDKPRKTCEALDTRDEDQDLLDTEKTGIRDRDQVDLAPRQEHQFIEDQIKSTSEQIFLLETEENKSALSSFQSQSSVSSEAQPQASSVLLVEENSASFQQSESTAGQENTEETKLEEKGKHDTSESPKLNVQADFSELNMFGVISVSKKEEEVIDEWCYREKQNDEPPSVPLVTLPERQECTAALKQNDIVQHLIVCEPNVGLSIAERPAEQSSEELTETKGRLEITSPIDEGLTGEEQLANVRAARHSENAVNTEHGAEVESALMQGISHSDEEQNEHFFSKIQIKFTEPHQSELAVDYDESRVSDKEGVDSALGDKREIKVQEENALDPNTTETGLILKEPFSKMEGSESSSMTQDDLNSYFINEVWQHFTSNEGNTEVSHLSFEEPVEMQAERIKNDLCTENIPNSDFLPSSSSAELLPNQSHSPQLPEKKDGDSDVEIMMSYGNLPSNKLPSQNTVYTCTPESPTETMNPKDQTSSSLQETFTTNNEPCGHVDLLNPAGSQHVLSEAHTAQVSKTQETHQTDYNSGIQKESFPLTDTDYDLKSSHLSKNESQSSTKPAGNRRKFGSSRRHKEKQHNKADEASQESKEDELTGRNEVTETMTMSQGEPEEVLSVAKVRKINSTGPDDNKSLQLQEGKTAVLDNALVDSSVAISDKEDSSKSSEDKHFGCGKEPENSAQLTGYDSVKNEKIQSSQASVSTSHPDTLSNLYHDDIISPESVLVPDQKEASRHCITLAVSCDKDSLKQEIHLEEDRNLLIAEDTNEEITADAQVRPALILEESVSPDVFHVEKSVNLGVKTSQGNLTSSELPEDSKTVSRSLGQLPSSDSGSSVHEMAQKNDNRQVDVQIPEVIDADEEEPGNKNKGMEGESSASPDLNVSKKKRKMGSTRRSLGSRAKDPQQRKELEDEVTNTLTIVQDKQTEPVPTFEEKHPQFPTEHGDGSSEQRHEELFVAVDSSHGDESALRPLAPEGSPDSESQLIKSEHLLAPNPPLTVLPKNDSVSEAAPGARRKKFGSNRKSHMQQNKKDQVPRDTEVAVEILVEEAAQEAKEEKSPQLDTISEVDKQHHKKGFPSISSTTVSKDTLAQSQQATIHLVKDHQKQLVFADPRGSDLISDSYNVVLIGDSSVGKTSFMKRAQNGKFYSEVQASIGLDSYEWTVVVDGKRVVLCLWDTAGQERFRSITRQIFHKAHAFLLMYDITSSQSFSAVSYWANCIQEAASENVTVVLLGNKSDHTKRQVKTQQGDILAKEYNFEFMECSAATGENVIEALETVGRLLSQRADLKEETTKLRRDPVQKKRSGCC
ncbi:Ras-related protein Rab-44 [Oryzias melastigma]|uniref:Ras-related protein Rab-44 n=1 Tax=Oryzias melastigma TaxID=30732 RepID=A0A834CQ94_ORYME|nr:Ras-related protein Rab-44 [Oryzias melastigma]